MNIVDILILLILGFSVIAGMYKGFFHSLCSTLGFAGAWIGARLVYEKVANIALSNNTLMAVLNQYLEPEAMFASVAEGRTPITQIIAGGESAIQSVVAQISEKFAIIARPFEMNIRNQAFAKLNISTLADYLDQTIWVALFNLLAFIVAFIVIYVVLKLIINLLDSVLHFPVLRVFDWLPGGLLGLVKGLVVVILIVTIAPDVIAMIDPKISQSLFEGSQICAMVTKFDLLGVSKMIAGVLS